ncbi:MAG TPA: aspartate aminotransferase family protein, partial [Bacteroidia bacterium]
FYTSLEEKTTMLVNGIEQQFKAKGIKFKVFQIGSIFWFSFSDKEHIRKAEDIDATGIKQFNELYHQLHDHGIYFGPSGYEVGFVCAAHTKEDIEKTICVFGDVLKK